jgi:hypothetical protein
MWGKASEFMWGRASALQSSADPCSAGSMERTRVVLIGRRIRRAGNVRCLAAAPPVRTPRSCARPHAAQHASDQRLGGTLQNSGPLGSLLLLPGCELRHWVTLTERRQVRDVHAGGSQLPVSSDAVAPRRERATPRTGTLRVSLPVSSPKRRKGCVGELVWRLTHGTTPGEPRHWSARVTEACASRTRPLPIPFTRHVSIDVPHRERPHTCSSRCSSSSRLSSRRRLRPGSTNRRRR